MAESPLEVEVVIQADGPVGDRLRSWIVASEHLELADGRSCQLILHDSIATAGNSPLVVLGAENESEMLSAVESGAMGYVAATASLDEIESALTTVAQGAAVVPPMMLGSLLKHTLNRRHSLAELEDRLSVLTERERQVVERLAAGMTRRDIAKELFISPETVRTHIQRAMAKLDMHSQNELLALLAPLERGQQ